LKLSHHPAHVRFEIQFSLSLAMSARVVV